MFGGTGILSILMMSQPTSHCIFPKRPGEPDPCGGFVLIALLWVLVALSFIALNLSSTVRTEINVAQASGDADRAYFLARGALEVVPYADGMNHFWIKGKDMTCHVAILDESGKVDLNYAEPETLQRLLINLGIEENTSTVLAEH